MILLYLIPILIVFGAQAIVTSVYNKYKNVQNKKNLTGFEIARKLLDNNNCGDIYVVETKGNLSDHYDPRRRTVRLSSEVFHESTIAAASIAAHECGHVIQHKHKYAPMRVRNAIVPIINLTSRIGYVVLIIGLIASVFELATWGIILLGGTLLFQLITLPVEFNASKRAVVMLDENKLIEKGERESVKAMLTAAALTYVASLIANALEILRLFLIFGLRGRDD